MRPSLISLIVSCWRAFAVSSAWQAFPWSSAAATWSLRAARSVTTAAGSFGGAGGRLLLAPQPARTAAAMTSAAVRLIAGLLPRDLFTMREPGRQGRREPTLPHLGLGLVDGVSDPAKRGRFPADIEQKPGRSRIAVTR